MVALHCLSFGVLFNEFVVFCFFLFFLMNLQGANASALEKEIGSEQFPVNEHYFGLVNVRILT